MDIQCIGFIGFGLIGGSIALALKEKREHLLCFAFNHKIEQPNMNLQQALSDGTLDEIVSDLNRFNQCDIIYLCAPVLANIEYLNRLKTIMKPSCILTDVGSVKGNITNAVNQLGLTKNFIGGHPMAGSEKTGYEHAHSKLLENAFYILTPHKDTPATTLEIMQQLVLDISAIPILLDAKEHDDITAAISHVPHIIAAALVLMVKDSDHASGKMRSLAAGGFKDITRIASSSPTMWQNICLTNRDSILTFLKQYMKQLDAIYQNIFDQKKESLYDTFCEASEYRSNLVHDTGLIYPVYELYLDLTDETGAIATVATLLASHKISIKNIGILHNREFQQGVLTLETYNANDLEKALVILTQNEYTVYKH